MLPPSNTSGIRASVARSAPKKFASSVLLATYGVEPLHGDAGVVDQDVEPRALALELVAKRRDACRVDDVELAVLHREPLVGEALRFQDAVLSVRSPR
jgi:hypothetical protein